MTTKKKTLKKRILRLFIFLLFGFLLFLHFYAPRFIIEIKNPIVEWLKTPVLENKQFDQNKGKMINFKSTDSLNLKAFLSYATTEKTKGTIILVHGIRGNKEHYIALSEQLNRIGYQTVAVDLRAHGESDGQFCTFGVKEKTDISSLINYLEGNGQISQPIGIWGQSLGGAVALQALGTDKRLSFGIIESTFTDFRSITHDYANYHLGFDLSILTNYLINRSGKIGSFNPDDAEPLTFCSKINQPILMVHGTLDKRISINYGRKNYDALQSQKKLFLEVKDAHHLNVWETKQLDYFKYVFKFIDSNI